MNEENTPSYRERLRPMLRDFLKTENIEINGAQTSCPCCSGVAWLLRDGQWRCVRCGITADVVDFAQRLYPNMSEEEAVRYIHEVLGIKMHELKAVEANELMDMEFQPAGWLIDKLLGKGVYLLAGASKIGKSWLVLWLADRVGKGEPVWEFETRQCGVLYVSLEDTAQRIQQRLSEVTDGEAEGVWIATEAELLGNGFEEQLCNFLTGHPEIGFVIIDTLQRIRQLKADKYSYAGDYSVMTALKGIADRYNITVLVVHHTRKAEAGDSFDMISGTTGLMGCSDGALVLRKQARNSRSATLEVTGRETADLKLRLEFDENKHWQFIGYADEKPKEEADPVLEAVRDFAAAHGEWHGTASELVEALGNTIPADLKPHILSRKLNANITRLAQRYGVRFKTTRTTDTREITLTSLSA